jgi:hypothetical protein
MSISDTKSVITQRCGAVRVGIDDEEPRHERKPNYMYDDPSISVVLWGKERVLFLTWFEARELAKALNNVTDVAEFG